MARDSTSVPERTSASTSIGVQRYFPLRVGYVWTYHEQVVTDADTVLLQRRVTFTVQSRHDREYVAHWDFQSGHTRLPNTRYRLVDDGIQQAQLTGDTKYTPFAYLLKAPLVVGQTWHTGQGAVVRIVAIHPECTVPAGTFALCVETLQEVDPAPESRVHTRRRFAPDVGLVWQQRRLVVNEMLRRVDTMQLQKLPERSQL
jgi:hypothetical protein